MADQTATTTGEDTTAAGGTLVDFSALSDDITSAIKDGFATMANPQGNGPEVISAGASLEVNEESLVLTDERYHLGLRRNPERVPKRLRAICEAMSLPLLDPRPALRAKESSGVRAYFPQDGHWNEVGNAVVAEELAPFVRRLLPCPQSRVK